MKFRKHEKSTVPGTVLYRYRLFFFLRLSESAAVSAGRVVVRVCRWVWMVVRFVCVIRHPCVRVCACVSRVCPGSPRCLFTGTVPHTMCILVSGQ